MSVTFVYKKSLINMPSLKEKILALLEETPSPRKFVYDSFLPGYHRDSIYKSLNQLSESGQVVDAEDLLETSANGRTHLATSGGYFQFRRHSWDGLWRLVFFDIPEGQREHRDRFRKDLRRRGFGLWQNSVWISPFNQDFFEDLTLLHPEIRKNLEMFKGIRLNVGEDDAQLAQGIWPIDIFNSSYRQILSSWQTKFSEAGESNINKLKEQSALLQDEYLTLLFSDPGLPQELLPIDWSRPQVQDISWQWRSILNLQGV